MIAPHRHFHRLAWVAVLLAFGIVVFGAFVRLSNAGLSCPDWPTCYGRAAWPVHAHEIATANASFERAVETHKAWRAQVHRHLAASLGVLILVLALLAARRRPQGVGIIAAAATLVGISIPVYIAQQPAVSAALVGAGVLMLLIAALRWNNSDGARLSTVVLIAVVLQAVLGMWTVTWLLKPIVVTAHLLGGLATFALLTCCGSGWGCWRCRSSSAAGPAATTPRCRAASSSRPASGAGGRRTTSARPSCCGAASAWTTRAGCSTARRAWRSSSRIAASRCSCSGPC
jgi:cytochrome c oxidase assembly protein subunit 15